MNAITQKILDALEFYADFDERDLHDDHGAIAQEALAMLVDAQVSVTYETALLVIGRALTHPSSPDELAARLVQLRDTVESAQRDLAAMAASQAN